MQALPFSLQSPPRLRDLNCLYVDKTKYAYDLLIQKQKFFLARPRRFGKSLFVSILEEILKGNKHLFDGLFISKSDYSWPIYGVIHLDFGPIKSGDSFSLEKSLCQVLSRVAQQYNLETKLDIFNPNQALIELVDALSKKFKKVAILIDEYDHPILQVLQDPEVIKVRTILQSFFTTVKSLNKQVHFLFITGVSMFSKAGVFSGMNNPQNISMDPQFAGICGYTDEEIDLHFPKYIKAWTDSENIPEKIIRDGLKTWYSALIFN